ncbi:hypothetical protein [Roseovarius pelagicus]|uniref:Uncharacterized protein n=1 Tax=Roseovarius pelagicus TaxID=2980108 RepID=A0ABY6DCJ4_9RHOB|nr:hypothetical protein [Roseovarius pelagicus]UXX83828.1 hypothetical protein N7U68_03985 [Roseovarius pelagicus]
MKATVPAVMTMSEFGAQGLDIARAVIERFKVEQDQMIPARKQTLGAAA